MTDLYFLADNPDWRDRMRAVPHLPPDAAPMASVTDLGGYLHGRETELIWRRFDRTGLPRIAQLIDSTHQFNLTARRYTEADLLAVMADPVAVGLQLRLLDRCGDNGMIGVVIGRLLGTALVIDTWLMSCRVAGRQIEQATLALLAAEARRLGARRLIGEYVPTARNAMVKEHYARLGFTVTSTTAAGACRAMLALAGYVPAAASIAVKEG